MARKNTQPKERYIKTDLVTFKLSEYVQHTFMFDEEEVATGWFGCKTVRAIDRKCVTIWFVDGSNGEYNFDTEEEAENFYESIQRQLK